MNPAELIQAGRLGEARTQLVEQVRARPGDMAARTLLFRTLCFLGEWAKAESHLGVVAAQDVGKEAAAQVYRNLLRAEREREAVWGEGKRPSLFPQSPGFLEEYFSARALLAGGKRGEAIGILERIAEEAALLRGALDGKPFEGFQDADPVLFPFLEAFVHDRYVWIPVASVLELKMAPPGDILDLLWAPAQAVLRGGVRAGCHLAVLYPGSCRHADDRVKMGRATEWVPGEGGLERGAGQHMFLAGEEEVALLDIREIAFEIPRTGDTDGTHD